MGLINWIIDKIVVRRMYGNRRDREMLFERYMKQYEEPNRA